MSTTALVLIVALVVAGVIVAIYLLAPKEHYTTTDLATAILRAAT